jgi:hypothetical protein
MDSVYFKPCALSQVSRRCSWRSHAKSKSTSQFLCNRSDRTLKVFGSPAMSRNFSVEDVRMLGKHCPDNRSSFSNSYKELHFSRHLFGKFLQDVRTTWQHVQMLPSIPECFEFPLRMWKGLTVKTVRRLGQAVRTWSCFEKNRVILERQSQKTIRARLSSVRTLHS